MMSQPVSRDGAIGGINIGRLFHFPVVPAAITSGPSHEATYDDFIFECGVPELKNESDFPRNSTCYTSHAHSRNVTFILKNFT